MRNFLIFFVLLVYGNLLQGQQLPPVFEKKSEDKSFFDSRTRAYIAPQRIVWQHDGDGKLISNPNALLQKATGQSTLSNNRVCVLRSTENEHAAILLDFGKELQGGIQLVSANRSNQQPVKIRVRFGESVSEAMSDIGGPQGATNDHAMRDFEMSIPWIGVAETGNSGFRFVRIDLLDNNAELALQEVNAIFTYRDIPYLGSFRCNDKLLNKIWMTGAYTVHLNMQEYLWDGIKRDRLVWVGDLHPEVMTVSTVFGYNEVVPKSLDLSRDITPLPRWMNDISSYSLWWIIIHNDWYRYQGNLDYLKEQKTYLTALLEHLLTKVDESGKENLGGHGRFLDWPSSENTQGIDAGLHALLLLAFESGSELCTALGEKVLASKCSETAKRMLQYTPQHNQSKQAAALMALSGVMPAEQANSEVIARDGAKNFSTFYGYYMLQAQAKAGDYQSALNNIRNYWGGMLKMGATSFWEDFNLDWMEGAAPIDELVPEGKKDIHADFGAYCYKNLRHSLCHGWASGPTSWLSEHVLGVQVLEPGCKVLSITPHLGDLEWAEGTFPTPKGVVHISHKKASNGKIITEVKAPKGIKIIKNIP